MVLMIPEQIQPHLKETIANRPSISNNTENMAREAQPCFDDISDDERTTVSDSFAHMFYETNEAFQQFFVDVEIPLREENDEIKNTKRVGIKLLEVGDENEDLKSKTMTTSRKVGEEMKHFYSIGIDKDGNYYFLNSSEDKFIGTLVGPERIIDELQDDPAYKKAKAMPGSIAAKYIPGILEIAGVENNSIDEVNTISTMSSVYDSTNIAGIVLSRYGIDTSVIDIPFLDAESVHKVLKQTDSNVDSYYQPITAEVLGLTVDSIEQLQSQRDELYTKVGDGEKYRKFLELTARAKQATWYACQDERAIYEQQPERITTKLNYNSFDGMVITQTADALINQIKDNPQLREVFDKYNLKVDEYENYLKAKDNTMVADFLARTVSILKGSRLAKITDQEYADQKLLIQNALAHSLLRTGFEIHKDIIEPIH